MGMPVTVHIADPGATAAALERAFDHFTYVDRTFSTYKPDSEISRINRGEIAEADYSEDMKKVFRLCEQTAQETNDYFNIIRKDGTCDPSGLVKGWAIYDAAQLLALDGWKEFYVDAGGDIEARGTSWPVGIRNPFNGSEMIKVLHVRDRGVATSGTYERGLHIYNPHADHRAVDEIVSLTVIGPNIYEADRYATPAFAMGREGIRFIERTPGLEGYLIDAAGQATMTSGFDHYTI